LSSDLPEQSARLLSIQLFAEFFSCSDFQFWQQRRALLRL
jgi:hypothetical protein